MDRESVTQGTSVICAQIPLDSSLKNRLRAKNKQLCYWSLQLTVTDCDRLNKLRATIWLGLTIQDTMSHARPKTTVLNIPQSNFYPTELKHTSLTIRQTNRRIHMTRYKTCYDISLTCRPGKTRTLGLVRCAKASLLQRLSVTARSFCWDMASSLMMLYQLVPSYTSQFLLDGKWSLAPYLCSEINWDESALDLSFMLETA